MPTVAQTTYENTPHSMQVNLLVNHGYDGSWNLGSSTISHTNDIGSYSEKVIAGLVIGNTYRVTYTISSYTNCNVQLYLGNTAGTIRTATGTYTEDLVLTGSYRKIRFYASGTASINSYLIQELVTTINDTPLDITTMQNNSWTLSFNPILNQWISFHSYLPNNYLSHPTKLLAKDNSSQIFLNNSGDFGSYFTDTLQPFIIETIFNEFKVNTKVFDSIRVIMSTSQDEVFTNTFFDEGIVYTENQCSGVIEFTPNVNITRKESNWNFNNFLDITNNVSEKIFVSDWDDIASFYPIDKVVNVSKINTFKPWYQRGRMRDNYLAVRFIDQNSDNTKFTCKFIISSFRASTR